MSNVIMAGELRGFDVPSVLQALSLSRQHTILKLWDRNRRETGEFRLKAGQLLDAIHGAARGRAALQAILRSRNHHSFRVERSTESLDLAEPLGQLASLLLDLAEAQEASKARRPVRPVTTAPPPPPKQKMKSSTSSQRLKPVSSRIAAVGPAVAEIAERSKPLEGLLLAKLPECLLCKSWSRSEPLLPADILTTFVAQVAQSQRTCFAGVSADSEEPRLTLELNSVLAMMEPITSELIAVYLFDPETPLGLARLTVSHLHEELEEHAREELLPLLRVH